MSILLLDDMTNRAITLLWPSLSSTERELSPLNLATVIATRLSYTGDPNTIWGKVQNLISSGLINYDGTVRADVKKYLAAIAAAKTNGLKAFTKDGGAATDPAETAVSFLSAMTLSERIDWLNDNDLLE